MLRRAAEGLVLKTTEGQLRRFFQPHCWSSTGLFLWSGIISDSMKNKRVMGWRLQGWSRARAGSFCGTAWRGAEFGPLMS